MHNSFAGSASLSLPRRPGLALASPSRALWSWSKKNELSLLSWASLLRAVSVAKVWSPGPPGGGSEPTPVSQAHTAIPTMSKSPLVVAKTQPPQTADFTSLFSGKVEFSEPYCIRRNMKRILYPLMALCYNNGMLSPPRLADRGPPGLANNYVVPWRVSVAVGTAS